MLRPRHVMLTSRARIEQILHFFNTPSALMCDYDLTNIQLPAVLILQLSVAGVAENMNSTTTTANHCHRPVLELSTITHLNIPELSSIDSHFDHSGRHSEVLETQREYVCLMYIYM